MRKILNLKKFLLFLLLNFTINNVYSDNSTFILERLKSIEKDIIDINTEVSNQNLISYEFNESISVNENDLQALEKKVEELHTLFDNSVLEKKLELAEATLKAYEKHFTSSSTIISLLLGFVGLLSIIFPLFSYFTGVKPANDAVKKVNEIEENFNNIIKEKMENYILEYDKQQMQNALKNIESDDEAQRAFALQYIGLNTHLDLDDNSLFIVYKLLNKKELETTYITTLELILSKQKSEWADRYFSDLMNDNIDISRLYFISKYYVVNYTDELKNIILDQMYKIENRSIMLTTFINYLLIFSKKLAIDFLNDENILKFIIQSKDLQYFETLINSAMAYNVNIEETVFFKQYKINKS